MTSSKLIGPLTWLRNKWRQNFFTFLGLFDEADARDYFWMTRTNYPARAGKERVITVLPWLWEKVFQKFFNFPFLDLAYQRTSPAHSGTYLSKKKISSNFEDWRKLECLQPSLTIEKIVQKFSNFPFLDFAYKRISSGHWSMLSNEENFS